MPLGISPMSVLNVMAWYEKEEGKDVKHIFTMCAAPLLAASMVKV